MSSLELSDEIYSSEDEDFIIANMETKSGLPEKGKVLQAAKEHTSDMKMIHSETAVASVKMSGAIRQGQNLYDSSESEDEDVISKVPTDLPSVKTNIQSTDSRSSSVVTIKSKSSSVTSSVVTINGNLNSDKTSLNVVSNGRHDSVDSIQSSDYPETPSSYKESRFNPFDRDLHIDEDHFDVKQSNECLPSRPRSNRIKSGK